MEIVVSFPQMFYQSLYYSSDSSSVTE